MAGCFAVVVPFVAVAVALPSDVTRALTQGYRWGLKDAAQIPLAVVFGLTAGYREEFFFRSYLLGRLDEVGVPVPLAVAASTLLFCVGHLYEGVLAIAITASLGVLLSAAWLRRRSLHVIAIAHGAYNTLVLCLSLVLPHALPEAAVMHIFFQVKGPSMSMKKIVLVSAALSVVLLLSSCGAKAPAVKTPVSAADHHRRS